MMTPDDQALYKGFKEMQTVALREGSHDRAKRFEQRMAALEDKTWGPVSRSAAASSSGSSSGDSASSTSMAAALAASVDAQAVVMAAHAAEKKLLEGLQKALDKITGSAAVKANEGVITLLTRPERVTAYCTGMAAIESAEARKFQSPQGLRPVRRYVNAEQHQRLMCRGAELRS